MEKENCYTNLPEKRRSSHNNFQDKGSIVRFKLLKIQD